MKRWSLCIPALVLLALALSASGAIAQSPDPQSVAGSQAAVGTGFTYQGQLKQGGNAFTANCEMAFRLYNDAASGAMVGSPITTTAPVTNSLFTVPLDFGASVFAGDARWLDIRVRCPTGVGSWAQLTPRQALTPAPYSLYAPASGTTSALLGRAISTTAPSAGQVLKWNGAQWSPADDAIGTPGSGDISAVYAGYGLSGGGTTGDVTLGVVTSTIQQRVMNGCVSGYAIRMVKQDGTVTCEPIPGASGWSLTGNAGTNASTNFVGTTDNVTVTLRVSNTVGWRLAPSGANTPNVIGGYSGNSVTSGVVGGVIGGGGASSSLNRVTDDFVVGGGHANQAGDDAGTTWDKLSATVGGGYYNIAAGPDATVGGGYNNTASGAGSFVGGGGYDGTSTAGNQAIGNASTIGGGWGNSIPVTGTYATVGGGDSNTASAIYATVAGGEHNIAQGNDAAVGGGFNNNASAWYNTIGGGRNNMASNWDATVGGGISNQAIGDKSFVGGGDTNTASGNRATVGGGGVNTASGNYATVGGGNTNTASGIGAFIGGGGYDGTSIAGNQAIGNASTIGGGWGNSIPVTGTYATVGGGDSNTASGDHATIGGGGHNSASNWYATVSGGDSNNASGDHATVPGGYYANASHYGEMAYASGQFTDNGDAQTSLYVVRNTTTNATPTELFLDGGGATSSRITIASYRTVTFDILVVARSNGGNSAGYRIVGLIENQGGATAFIGAPTVTTLGEDVAAWDVAVVADDANDALEVKVTGAATTTIRWVASVRTVEVSY